MAPAIALAFAAGMLVTLSRQLNGRLALETSALGSSFWNHLVGLTALVLWALILGHDWPQGAGAAPFYAWTGGVLAVAFVAGGSWLIPRLGAAMTGGLLVAGQMIAGVMLDLIRGNIGSLGLQMSGVALILAGIVISRRTPKPSTPR